MRDQCSVAWQIDIGFFVTLAIFAVCMIILAFVFYLLRIIGSLVVSIICKGTKKKTKNKKSKNSTRKNSSRKNSTRKSSMKEPFLQNKIASRKTSEA